MKRMGRADAGRLIVAQWLAAAIDITDAVATAAKSSLAIAAKQILPAEPAKSPAWMEEAREVREP